MTTRFLVVVLTTGDDELLVRASAVLKSQGPENWHENWSRGRPGKVLITTKLLGQGMFLSDSARSPHRTAKPSQKRHC